MFWQALEQRGAGERLPVNALIARIDVERLDDARRRAQPDLGDPPMAVLRQAQRLHRRGE